MIKLDRPVIVEGKYDIIKLSNIIDGLLIKTDGFGIFNSKEKQTLIKKLAKETGCAYHVCHISTKESVDIIRQAKKDGVDITCETGPHYLVMNDMMLKDEGRFKMNPPLRGKEDKIALIEGIKDGTIDMIATDHAPHSAEEKSKGLEGSAMGIVGIETAFPILYTKLVKEGIITLEKLIELMSINPRKRFGLPATEDICVFDVWLHPCIRQNGGCGICS